jgi:putative ABC transport system ATP-binding protein
MSVSPQPIINCKNITKVVNKVEGQLQILAPLTFQVQAGTSLAIVGASGSGKSTLLSLLAGLDQVSDGSIDVDGQPLHNMNEEQRAQLRGEKIGFIFQSFMLVQSLTALENIMLPAEIAGLPNAKQLGRDILQQVGLEHRGHHYPNQLSGGEQQRVAVARAFITKPKILFADEPTGNLDAANSARVEDLLFSLNTQSNTTLILVTHDTALAARCQSQIKMQAGQIIQKDEGTETVNNEEISDASV